ncbi:hypothetical protein KUV41_04610, partial [Halomonas sp. DP8Y7-1]|uniref:hypothetical protein n=1 Tax=Halomonas sp. DP8Y7-1 TaxID=2859078 RepID=UPI001C97C865
APCEEGVFYRIEAFRQALSFASCKRCSQTSKESEACFSAPFDALSTTPIKWRAFYRFLVARQAVIFPRS